MFLRSVATQTNFLLKRKPAIIVFYILLTMVLGNYFYNVYEFQGRDVIEMYQPMRLLLLSYDMSNYQADRLIMLVQLCPVLFVIPAGFSYTHEQQLKQDVLMIGRIGCFTYNMSKMTAVFITTFLVFTVPFLFEIVLNCISFPIHATGNFFNADFYHPNYIKVVNNYMLKTIFLISPYLYAVIGTLFWGATAGLLGMFTMAVSTIVNLKFRIVLFLPVFLLLQFSLYIDSLSSIQQPTTAWYSYLLLFEEYPKNMIVLYISLGFLMLFSVFVTAYRSRKDCLS
jgi:hypothetical protein